MHLFSSVTALPRVCLRTKGAGPRVNLSQRVCRQKSAARHSHRARMCTFLLMCRQLAHKRVVQGGGVAIIKVKRTKDDTSRASILAALEKVCLHEKERVRERARARARQTERERERESMRIGRCLCTCVQECIATHRSTLDTHQHVYQHAYLASIRKGHSNAASTCGPVVRRASDSALGESGIKCTADFRLCRQPRTTSTTPSSTPGSTPPPLLPSPLVTAAPPVYTAVSNALDYTPGLLTRMGVHAARRSS